MKGAKKYSLQLEKTSALGCLIDDLVDVGGFRFGTKDTAFSKTIELQMKKINVNTRRIDVVHEEANLRDRCCRLCCCCRRQLQSCHQSTFPCDASREQQRWKQQRQWEERGCRRPSLLVVVWDLLLFGACVRYRLERRLDRPVFYIFNIPEDSPETKKECIRVSCRSVWSPFHRHSIHVRPKTPFSLCVTIPRAVGFSVFFYALVRSCNQKYSFRSLAFEKYISKNLTAIHKFFYVVRFLSNISCHLIPRLCAWKKWRGLKV